MGDEVFKTPKSSFEGKFDHELYVLQTMQGKGLPVPELTYVGKEAKFFGMKKMQGAQLALGFFVNCPEEEQRQLAKDIVKFVVDMAASFPLKENGKFMTHGDLHVGNVLIDTKTRKLAGILDFGLAAYVGETDVRPTATPDVNDWRPYLRYGSNKPHEKLHEFNEMLHEEYLVLRRAVPVAAKPASPFKP
jgi:tRNA A-37 threonylcarbamoyl transferase component Bud32